MVELKLQSPAQCNALLNFAPYVRGFGSGVGYMGNLDTLRGWWYTIFESNYGVDVSMILWITSCHTSMSKYW